MRELAYQTIEHANPMAQRDGFNVVDLAEDLERHGASLAGGNGGRVEWSRPPNALRFTGANRGAKKCSLRDTGTTRFASGATALLAAGPGVNSTDGECN